MEDRKPTASKIASLHTASCFILSVYLLLWLKEAEYICVSRGCPINKNLMKMHGKMSERQDQFTSLGRKMHTQ